MKRSEAVAKEKCDQNVKVTFLGAWPIQFTQNGGKKLMAAESNSDANQLPPSDISTDTLHHSCMRNGQDRWRQQITTLYK
jgi:hypothetical protein